MSLAQQEPNTGGVHDTLLHGETLFIVSSGNLEDVSFELITNGVTWNLLTHTLVDESTESTVIVDFNELLSAVGGVSVIVGKKKSAIELSGGKLWLNIFCIS